MRSSVLLVESSSCCRLPWGAEAGGYCSHPVWGHRLLAGPGALLEASAWCLQTHEHPESWLQLHLKELLLP